MGTNPYFFIGIESPKHEGKYLITQRVIDGDKAEHSAVIAEGKWQYDRYDLTAKRIAIQIKHDKFAEFEVNMLGIEHSVKWDEVDDLFHIIFSEATPVLLKIGMNNEGFLWIRLCN